MSSTKSSRLKLLFSTAVFLAFLVAVTTVHAAGATVVLDRSSGPAGTPVTATYTAPGCGGGIAATVAFSLDDIAGRQFGTTSMNPATCSATLTFPISGSAGAHQIFGYVPNSGAPVASAPFTILAAPPATPTPVPTATPTPTPSPTTTLTPTPAPTATPAAKNSNSFLNGLLVPALIAIIALLIIAVVVLLVLLRRKPSRTEPGSPPAGGPPASP